MIKINLSKPVFGVLKDRCRLSELIVKAIAKGSCGSELKVGQLPDIWTALSLNGTNVLRFINCL